jgi:hypothetical protein
MVLSLDRQKLTATFSHTRDVRALSELRQKDCYPGEVDRFE